MSRNFKGLVRNLILIVAIIVLTISLITVYTGVNEYYKNNKLYNDIDNLNPFKNNDLSIAYTKLKELNEDYVGWLYIPGTKVNYPIVKGTDNSFYLNHNFLKEESKAGSIFIDCNINEFEDRNTIIYGHYMKDGSMFADLHKLLKSEFNSINNKIYIFTDDNILEYNIFSIYSEKASIDSYLINWTDDTAYDKYLNNLKGKSIYNSTITLDSNDKILTLSTCSFDIENGRLLVHARLLIG